MESFCLYSSALAETASINRRRHDNTKVSASRYQDNDE